MCVEGEVGEVVVVVVVVVAAVKPHSDAFAVHRSICSLCPAAAATAAAKTTTFLVHPPLRCMQTDGHSCAPGCE